MNYKKMVVRLYEEEMPPEKRTMKNCPKYSTGKLKMPLQQWLNVKSNGGQGSDGKFYGWSHRAFYGFGAGDKVSGDSMAHVDYKWEDSDNGIKHKSYTIKTDKEAKEHAIRFMKAVD